MGLNINLEFKHQYILIIFVIIIILTMIRLVRTWRTATIHVLTVEPQWIVTSILRDRSQVYKYKTIRRIFGQNWDLWSPPSLQVAWLLGKTWRHHEHWASWLPVQPRFPLDSNGNLNSSVSSQMIRFVAPGAALMSKGVWTILPHCHI